MSFMKFMNFHTGPGKKRHAHCQCTLQVRIASKQCKDMSFKSVSLDTGGAAGFCTDPTIRQFITKQQSMLTF